MGLTGSSNSSPQNVDALISQNSQLRADNRELRSKLAKYEGDDVKGNSSVLKFQCVFNQEDDEQNFGELVRAFLKHLSINVAGPLATSPEQVSADAIVLFFQFLGTTRFIEKSTDRFKAINRAHPSGQRVFVICFHHGREFLWLKSEETPYLVDCEKVRRSTKQLTDKFQSLKEK